MSTPVEKTRKKKQTYAVKKWPNRHSMSLEDRLNSRYRLVPFKQFFLFLPIRDYVGGLAVKSCFDKR